MKRLLILVAYLCVTLSQTINLVGNYQDFKEFQSSEYIKVLDYVKNNHAEINQLDPISVKRQVLHGHNYQITFKHTENCYSSVTVYVRLEMVLSETLYHYIPQQCKTTINKDHQMTLAHGQMMLFGGETDFDGLKSQEFQPILSFIRQNNPYLQKIAPVSVKTQIVAGKNFKVTFKPTQSCQVVIKVYRNIEKVLEETENWAAPENCNSDLRKSHSKVTNVTNHQSHSSHQQELPTLLSLSTSIPAPSHTKDIKLGGYTQFSDFSDSSFKKVLASLYLNHPQINNKAPQVVFRQVVSGFNYKFLFQVNAQCSLEIVIYQNIQGITSERSYSTNPQNCVKKSEAITHDQGQVFTEALPEPIRQPNPILVGGYHRYDNTKSDQFAKVLSFINKNHNYLEDLWPNLVQRQVVNGFNYRITYDFNPSCSFLVVVYSTFQQTLSESYFKLFPQNCHNLVKQSPEHQSPAIIEDSMMLFGGETDFDGLKSQEFQPILSFIRQNNPYLQKIAPVSVKTQIVAGKNFKVTFKPTQSCQVVIKVYRNIEKVLEETENWAAPENCNSAFKIPHHFTNINETKQPQVFYEGFTNFQMQSEKFKEILSFVNKNIPELSQKTPTSGQIQIFNGPNYKIYYDLPQFNILILVSHTSTNNLTITSYQTNNQKPIKNKIIHASINHALLEYPYLKFYDLLNVKLTYSDSIIQYKFLGHDNYTTVTFFQDATNLTNLKDRALIITCAPQTSCRNSKIAHSIFKANHHLMKKYQQLQTNYTLSKFQIKNQSPTSFAVNEIFTHDVTKQENVASFIVTENQFQILALTATKF